MNGYVLIEESARLIGLDFADEKLKIIGLTLVNTILCDLGYMGIKSLSNPLGITNQKVLDALKFGVAALGANAVGDGAMAENMSGIYRDKKGRLNAKISSVRDTLPRGEW